MTDAATTRRKKDLHALLLRQTTEGLGAADAAYLDALLQEFPEADANEFEVAAAAVLLASLDTSEPMPAALRERLEVSADRFIDGRR